MGEKADSYPKVAQLRTVDQLRERLDQLGISLPMDDELQTAEAGSPLAESFDIGGFHAMRVDSVQHARSC